ncbi:ATPase [Solihabitans fulvus]|uniref:ATPase n=1 Tax=Solihabitans fulvus TaxID=1892852 RepID=A0A5B2XGL1_9PSEU|nr:BadF/BadG/BcrA/BcrD ATPase family protein [Solihabitans fulvus]KAA2262386.1 ATPase [Solihabitans fulvus]
MTVPGSGVVVGLDAGGTATRALVFGLDGSRLAAGLAGGGNPNSHAPATAAEQIGTALRTALEGMDAGQVRAGVLGMAGASKVASDSSVAALFEAAWKGAGLRCPMRVVTDSEAAFASGTAEPDGTVLVAGTGSIAARIVDRKLVATSGGYGWLLGDEGSAYWLGREAVRGTLRALESATGSAASEGLPAAVLAQALQWRGPVVEEQRRTLRQRLITAVNAATPIQLARFAPLVSASMKAGDGSAARIVAKAAQLLADTALMIRGAEERTPMVLVGSLLGPGSPVGTRLRAELAERTEARVRVATEGAAGAAWLAALEVLGPSAPRPSYLGA